MIYSHPSLKKDQQALCFYSLCLEDIQMDSVILHLLQIFAQ